MSEKDVVIGFKGSRDLQEKVDQLVDISALNKKQWLEKAVRLMEMNELKDEIPEYKNDITELEGHVARIYELFTGMIQQSNYLISKSEKSFEEKIMQKEKQLAQAETEIKELKEKRKTIEENTKAVEDENEELKSTMQELRDKYDLNSELTNEYKEKIVSLTNLLDEYKTHQMQNEELNQALEMEKEKHESALREQIQENEALQTELKDLNQELDHLKTSHENEIKQLQERFELDKEKAELNVEKRLTGEITKLNNEHHAKLVSVYDEMNEVRKQYEERIALLQEDNKIKEDDILEE